ncbi:MAG: DUF819 family protein [Rhodothermales bacterium]|nr:DUF819 family protein [Rhodothermales bacterium]
MTMDSLYIFGMLSAFVVLSEFLVRRTFLKHLGTALLVILVTAVAANAGLLPTGSTPERPVPAYGFIFSVVAPLAIFWLLLPVNLRDVLKAGLPMIGLFLLGSIATAVGGICGMWVIDGRVAIGENWQALGGMFVGTYTGGSVNFNALALNYGVVEEGVLYGGAVVVDNIITTVWMIVTLAIPRLFAHIWPKRAGASDEILMGEATTGEEIDTETVHPLDLGIVLALGFGGVWLADLLAAYTPGIPSVIILTALALVIAQIPGVSKLPGVRLLGMYAVYLFLAVIGAYADLGALAGIGDLGTSLLVFAVVTVTVHGLLIYSASLLLKIDPVIASVASQANVGGGASALALARSLGREDLVLPAVLIGSLGYALGTFLGFWVAEYWLVLVA